MRSYREEKRNTQIISGVIVLTVLIVFSLFARAVFSVYQKEQLARNQKDIIEEKVYTLEEKRGVLKRELERLETERGVEEEIREKFRVVKEGEQLVILVDDQEASVTKSRPIEKKGWFSRLFDWF